MDEETEGKRKKGETREGGEGEGRRELTFQGRGRRYET